MICIKYIENKKTKKTITFKLFFFATVSYHKPKRKENKCAYKVYCDKIQNTINENFN